MEKKFTRITFFIGAISSLFYLVFIFLRNYNSPENIEAKSLLLTFEKSKPKFLDNESLKIIISGDLTGVGFNVETILFGSFE